LEAAGDPDFRSMRKDFAPGVKIGWKRRMPRTPAVYERMKEWRLKTSEGPAENSEWQANYSTSMDRRQDLILRFEKDEALNMMKSMTFKEAKKRWGSRLKVAAIGAVEQVGKEWRFTHDATHGVRVNHYIKPRDKIRSPMGGDVKRTVADIEEEPSGGIAFSLIFDVARAHRKVAVAEDDWGLQACTTKEAPPVDSQDDEEEVKVNTVCTYGVGSAAYWWSRIGGAAIRMLHYIIGRWASFWLLFYADDGMLTAKGRNFYEVLIAAMALLTVFGFPLKWEKLGGGITFDWIGYWVDTERFRVGVSARRAAWLREWGAHARDKGTLTKEELPRCWGDGLLWDASSKT
jgi:hypothetical protein